MQTTDLHLALGPLRLMIERIVVHPLTEGGFELATVGAIAAMVGLGQSAAGKKSRPMGGFVCVG